MSSPGRPRILYLEDDERFCLLFARALERADLDVDVETVSGRDAFRAALDRGGVDLVVSDRAVSGYSGLAALRDAVAREIAVPFVFLSGYPPPEGTQPYLAAGAADYLLKDDLPGATDAIRRLLRAPPPPERAPRRAEPPATWPPAPLGEEPILRAALHDLRNPVWLIRGFGDLLRGEARSLSEAGRSALDDLLTATDELRAVLDGLGELVGVSDGPLSPAAVDVSASARLVAARLSSAAPARGVEWRVSDGLEVRADPALLGLVVDKLLSNAFKFTAARPTGLIEVGPVSIPESGADPGLTGFFVRDNGVGFDPALALRLFAPLQRLHSMTTYPGVGMGLAIVKRIVQRHGGRVWAEGTAGGGATFRVALPAA